MDINHILSTNHYYYLKMISSGGDVKFIKIDMKKPYNSIDEIYDNMENYIKDGVCWKILDRNIYMCSCNCSDVDNQNINENVFSRYTIWFIKIKNKETGDIFYLSTSDTKIYPIVNFKEVFNNVKIPEGYVIDDYKNLYICNVNISE